MPGSCLCPLTHFPRLSTVFDGDMVLFVMGTVNMSIPSAERAILTNFLGAISGLLPALDGVHIPWSIVSELQRLNPFPQKTVFSNSETVLAPYSEGQVSHLRQTFHLQR